MSDERVGGVSPENTSGERRPAAMPSAQPTTKVTANGKRVRVRRWKGSTPALAATTQVVLGLVVLLQVCVALSDLSVKDRLASSSNLDEVLEDADRMQAWTAVNPWLALAGAVLFLVWFHRVWVSERSTRSPTPVAPGWPSPAGSSPSPA